MTHARARANHVVAPENGHTARLVNYVLGSPRVGRRFFLMVPPPPRYRARVQRTEDGKLFWYDTVAPETNDFTSRSDDAKRGNQIDLYGKIIRIRLDFSTLLCYCRTMDVASAT